MESGPRYVVFGREGSYDRLAIREMIRGGEIIPTTDLSLEGQDDWRPASAFPELQRYLSLATSQNDPGGGSATKSEKAGSALILAAAALTAVAMFLAADSLSDVVTGISSLRWPSVEGRLVNAHTLGSRYRVRRRVRRHRIHVSYRYSVAGTEYYSQTYGAGRWRWRSYLAAESALRNVRTGPLKVYYDPELPRKSVLRRGVSFETAARLLMALLALAAGMLAILRPQFARQLGRGLMDSAVRIKQRRRGIRS